MNGHEARLLIYSQDGLGLGHMRRTSLLAGGFLQQLPGASILTMSDSPLGSFFPLSSGHDYMKLPSIRKAGPGNWEAVSLTSSVESVLAMRSSLIASAVDAFEPDVLLVDHMPHGAMGELVPALRRARRRPMSVVLGLRDILDAPEVVRRSWTEEGAFEAVEEFYDDVLVYGCREVFDVAAEYGWPDSISSRLTYCGFVSEPRSSVDKPIRKRHRKFAEGAPLVLVVAGGGADAYPMFESVLRSVQGVHAETGARFLMVTGPFMPEREVRTLKRRSADLPVIVSTKIKNSMAYMAAADLVVAMAGYNTTMEVLNSGTKALFIPRRGPSAEQRTRARLFADHGWVRWLDPDSLAPSVVTDAIADALAEPTSTAVAPDLRGRETAVGRLVGHAGLVAQELDLDLDLELEVERVAG